MDIIFFTGFPGFLGSELLPRVLKRRHPRPRILPIKGASEFANRRLEGC